MKKTVLRYLAFLVATILLLSSLASCSSSDVKKYVPSDHPVSTDAIIYGYYTVTTPKGSKVQCARYEELTPAKKKECNDYCSRCFPKAVKIAEPTAYFNCHSYAWYSQVINNNHYWINDPSIYMTDGSYSKKASCTLVTNVSIPADAKNNDKVFYRTNPWDLQLIHSAILTEKSNKMLTSKWGNCGLYKHTPSNCPYMYSDVTVTLEFYR